MASVAELKKSFFAEIDKVENREDLEKLREKGILTAVLRSLGGVPLAKRKELGPQAQELKREVEKLLSNRMEVLQTKETTASGYYTCNDASAARYR